MIACVQLAGKMMVSLPKWEVNGLHEKEKSPINKARIGGGEQMSSSMGGSSPRGNPPTEDTPCRENCQLQTVGIVEWKTDLPICQF